MWFVSPFFYKKLFLSHIPWLNIRLHKKTKKGGVIPLSDRVLLKPLSVDEYTTKRASGIIIPESVHKERPEQGKVIAVGPGRYDDGVLIPCGYVSVTLLCFQSTDMMKLK